MFSQDSGGIKEKEVFRIGIIVRVNLKKDGRTFKPIHFHIHQLINCQFWIKNNHFAIIHLPSDYVERQYFEVDEASFIFENRTIMNLYEGQIGSFYYECSELVFTKEVPIISS